METLIGMARNFLMIASKTEEVMPLIFDGSTSGDTVTVFRVENAEGVGPYNGLRSRGSRGAESWDWMEEHHSGANGRPSPEEDRGFEDAERDLMYGFMYPHMVLCAQRAVAAFGEIPKRIRFAFTSRGQVERWFTENELVRLDSLGFSVVAYQARRVWDSGRQCMFEPA